MEEIGMDRAVFLDRDGVVNEVHTIRVNVVRSPDDVYLLPGAAEALKNLNDEGFKVFIITNQSRIGHGYMNEKALTQIHLKLLALLLGETGARIDDFVYCPIKPLDECECRKPMTAIIVELAEKHKIDLAHSFTIGDMRSDIMAGNDAGTHTIIIKEKDEVIPVIEEAYVAVSLQDAVKQILCNRYQ
jgi:D-glycero-D-manno-heptose 1,7-bisphosphate phosphatase